MAPEPANWQVEVHKAVEGVEEEVTTYVVIKLHNFGSLRTLV